MKMNGVTGEELESMQSWIDKLVLYGVFGKHQGSRGNEKEPRYYLAKPFIHHMKQFILWLDNNPALAKADDGDGVVNMVHSLLLYYAANRRLDQAQAKVGQKPTGDVVSFT
jgi:hypothetical protein